MRELLTGYGPVALIWFDTPRIMTGDRATRSRSSSARSSPTRSSTAGSATSGDYVSTGDNVIPRERARRGVGSARDA